MDSILEPEKAPKKRRINTSVKGAAIELLAIKILEEQGYKVHRCIRTGAKRGPFWVSQSNDIFGCLDALAVKKGHRVLGVQVTSHSGVGVKTKEIDAIPWPSEHFDVQLWRFVGGRRDRKHKVTGAALGGQFFQIYRRDSAWALNKEDRIQVT